MSALSDGVYLLQDDSLARGPKLLSIENYVINIMTWKFIYTYRERCKTGPAHNRCWKWSPFNISNIFLRFTHNEYGLEPCLLHNSLSKKFYSVKLSKRVMYLRLRFKAIWLYNRIQLNLSVVNCVLFTHRGRRYPLFWADGVVRRPRSVHTFTCQTFFV
jgi:hypothetical protein